MSVVTGSTDGFLGGHTKMTPATVQPVAARRFATDVIASQFVVRVATETVVVGATTSVISSGSAARVGDQILFTSGTLSGQTFTVVDQLSTTYTLGQEASSAPSGGDSFYVLRYRAPEVSSTGASVVDTELSDATLLADGDAIPTCGKVGAVVMGKNTSGTLDIAKLAKAHDVDSGAGTEYAIGITKRVAASGGSIAETYGAGAVAAGTQRMTLASDDPAVTSLNSLLTELYVNNGAMAMQVDDVGGGITYQGWATPGSATSAASWRIRRITEATNDYSIVFADGNRNFDNIWDNRLTLSYS